MKGGLLDFKREMERRNVRDYINLYVYLGWARFASILVLVLVDC
jgi:hypothetical protein